MLGAFIQFEDEFQPHAGITLKVPKLKTARFLSQIDKRRTKEYVKDLTTILCYWWNMASIEILAEPDSLRRHEILFCSDTRLRGCQATCHKISFITGSLRINN